MEKHSDLLVLELENRNLKQLPEYLSDCVSLRVLKLKGNHIEELPAWLEGLKDLTVLDLSDNRLNDLSSSIKLISKLSKLEVLKLGRETDYINSDNYFLDCIRTNVKKECVTAKDHIPYEITSLKNLKKLDIKGLGLTELPEWLSELHMLEELDFSNNEIAIIPESIVKLNNLTDRGFKPDNNPLSRPPVSIAKKGLQEIRNYYSAAGKGSEEERFTKWNQAKIVLVGRGTVGKTTLRSAILDRPGKVDVTMTRGVEIVDWPFELEGKKYYTKIWDFGGQDIYYTLHELFVTKNTLYLYVWESRSLEGNEEFMHKYWLNDIKTLGGNSPAIMIQNKVDEYKTEISRTQYKESFDNIVGFHDVSAITGIGVDVLKDEIKKHIPLLKHMKEDVPIGYIRVKEKLEQLEKKGSSYIEYSKYLDICKSFELNQEEARTLAEHLNDIGVVLFNGHDTVILNPTWATGAFYKLIDSSFLDINKGYFALEDLPNIWDDRDKYPLNKHEFLINLLCEYNYCFEDRENKKFVIPERLPVNQPSDLKLLHKSKLIREYLYHHMPKGTFSKIISRLVLEMHKEKRKSRILAMEYWQNGIDISFIDGGNILIVCDRLNSRIAVYADRPGLRKNFYEIQDLLIPDEDDNLIVKENVPCICKVCKELKEIKDSNSENDDKEKLKVQMYDYNIIKKRLDNMRKTIECHNSADDVDIMDLLERPDLDGDDSVMKDFKDAFSKEFRAGDRKLRLVLKRKMPNSDNQ